ncbi:MAG: hypothetical protein KGL31_04085 [candidate division NC10 bacterium]|nr:hypothetical protein [candidate division NC10 bacterium]MDE2321082.1 hypothetical protein [candidate division NC10 bacterium]
MAVALVAILAVVSFTGVAFATHLITGEVVSANPSTKTLVINAQGHEITFSVMESAVHAMADLKPGAKVAVVFSEGDGKLPVCHHVFLWPTGG